MFYVQINENHPFRSLYFLFTIELNGRWEYNYHDSNIPDGGQRNFEKEFKERYVEKSTLKCNKE